MYTYKRTYSYVPMYDIVMYVYAIELKWNKMKNEKKKRKKSKIKKETCIHCYKEIGGYFFNNCKRIWYSLKCIHGHNKPYFNGIYLKLVFYFIYSFIFFFFFVIFCKSIF